MCDLKGMCRDKKHFSCQFFFGDLKQTAQVWTQNDNSGSSTSLAFYQDDTQAHRARPLKNLIFILPPWKDAHTIGCSATQENKALLWRFQKYSFYRLLQWARTQRLEYAAHVFYCTHLESGFGDVTKVTLVLNSSDSLTCQRRPREATQAHKKHGEPHRVVDPLGSHKIDLREHNSTLHWHVWRPKSSDRH